MSQAGRRWLVAILVTATAGGGALLYTRFRNRDRLLDAAGYLAALPPSAGFTFSYYIPGKGTVGTTPGLAPEAVSLKGESLPFPLYVLSDIGRFILRLGVSGRVEWAVLLSKRCRGIGVAGGELFYPRGDEVVNLDGRTGQERRRFPVEDLGHLNFVNFTEGRLILGYSGEGPGRVKVCEETADGRFLPVWTNPHETNGARHAGTRGRILYVADTFGHRCYAVDMDSSRLLWERPSYNPCFVEPAANDEGSWLLVEEHANRLLKFKGGEAQARTIFSCPDSLYADPASTPDLLRAGEAMKVFRTSQGALKGSACEESSGEQTLYSPNGACQVGDGRLIVADTDNHRLVVIRNGRIVSTLRGFNNPVKVVRAAD